MKTPLAVVIGLLCAASADACTCGWAPLEAHYRRSMAVFSGRVMRVDWVSDRRLSARIRVLEAWKGVKKGHVVTVTTGPGGGMCGAGFWPGTKFLVFARGSTVDSMTTSICDNTHRLPGKSADVDSLRRWKKTKRLPG